MKPGVLLLLLCVLLGCGEKTRQATGQVTPEPASDRVMVSNDAVNYMHDWEIKYTLIDLRDNQPIGGAIVGVLEGPGGKNCCIGLPKQWQPGMKVRVEWIAGDKEIIKPETFRRDLEIPRYSQVGDLYVLFHPNDEVELVVSAVEPGHPNWPGREKALPYLACVARLSEKACRKYLPKYPLRSPDYAAYEMRKGCSEEGLKWNDKEFPHMKIENRQACERMMRDCKEKWAVTDKAMCSLDYKDD
ncbi:DUF3304 domain-containing protein [Chitinivorax sp. B]|uniref:DUF3304 domain-containing protein n=1 Tax=Chitinivorax sp. B TaxID=2502235 RepID=UPI0010F7D589|nr:DUF3304 domain-containing protein [Chitinivorax sp. B]